VVDAVAPFLEAVAATPLTGSPLAAIDADALAWRSTGAALWQAARDRGPAGQEKVFSLLRTLPAELRRALGVEP
jgi:hypothetical protein